MTNANNNPLDGIEIDGPTANPIPGTKVPVPQSAAGQPVNTTAGTNGAIIASTGNGTIWTITIPNGSIASGITGNNTIVPNTFTNTTVYVPPTGWYFFPQVPAETEAKPAEEKKSEPCVCAKCNEMNEFAAPNQDDGTFVCWKCKNGY